jgi:putative phosphoesterase
MKIGILSDTHNNQKNLLAALDLFKSRQVDTLIHCGDFTGADIVPLFQGFHVISVFGNGDIASGEIRAALLNLNPENYAGMVYTGRIDGARIAVTHGHVPGQVDELVHSGQYDYVFKGHSHQHKVERYNFTRLINPGALGGLHREDRQICLLDLYSGKADFIKISTD